MLPSRSKLQAYGGGVGWGGKDAQRILSFFQGMKLNHMFLPPLQLAGSGDEDLEKCYVQLPRDIERKGIPPQGFTPFPPAGQLELVATKLWSADDNNVPG